MGMLSATSTLSATGALSVTGMPCAALRLSATGMLSVVGMLMVYFSTMFACNHNMYKQCSGQLQKPFKNRFKITTVDQLHFNHTNLFWLHYNYKCKYNSFNYN